jgi:TetR/AcrR family fatty acid metabolism transcriptional regulator
METYSDDFDETDEKILDAAERIFAEHGYHDTVVADVAAEAGVGKGTVYRRFGNKSDLFSALICEGTDRLIQQHEEEIDRSDSLEERLRSIVSLHFDFFEESSEIFGITIQEGLSNFGEWQEDVVERWSAFRSLLTTYFEDPPICDQLREDISPEDCANLVCNLLFGTLRNIVIFEEENPRATYEEDILNVLLDGVKKDE